MKLFGKELKFNDNKVYHAGDKPTPSEIGAAAASHGTHVTYSTTAPSANGTASAGSANNVSRGDHVHPLQTTVSGNAGTATKLQTGRTLTIGSTGKSFDGSANVSWSVEEIGAARGSRVYATTAATAGWYRIAQTEVDMINNLGFFLIKSSVASYHSSTLLNAGITYGANPTLQQLSHTNYTNSGLTQARIVYHTTYQGNYAYLEVYLSQAKAATITVELFGTDGWKLVSPSTAGSIPSGYTSKAITFASNKIVGDVNGSLSGNASTATKATQDSAGQQINTTYIKGLSVSGTTVTYTKGDGTTGTITTQNTDTKVTNTLGTTTKAYITGTTSATTNTGTQIFDTGVYLDTTAGMLTATTFKGELSGNAKTATIATTCSGNAGSATKLSTARTINGTSFDGTANITTANWGTARNISIADNAGSNTGTAVSVNGSGNVTLKLPSTIAATLSGNASTATKLATARTISLGGIVKGSASFDGSGNITISASANDITTITKSLTVTTSWIDTGITGTNLATGTYAVQMLVNDGTNTSQYQEYYSGIMSWFADTTNSTDADEILLHKAGHASNGRHVYLRTIRTANSGRLKLQISCTNAFSAASSITFKFKKLI